MLAGPSAENANNGSINAVGEMPRVSLMDFRPTAAQPPARTATTYMGGLLSESEARHSTLMYPLYSPQQQQQH